MAVPNRDVLRALVDDVGRFSVRDRRLRRAQEVMVAALAAGAPPVQTIAAYVGAVRRYFAGFEREARRRLGDVERRLAHVSQVQFNLTAERGVAARRVEAVQGVLAKLDELAKQ